MNGIADEAPKIAVTLAINAVIGGDDPCAVAWNIAWAAKHLYDNLYSNPYFAMTVFRHNRGFGRVDTCLNVLQVNGDVQRFETVRLPWVHCTGES